eukprot:g1627.t1
MGAAVSNGGPEIYLCDPMSGRWGCTEFDPPTPPNTNCVMKNKQGRIMTWAQAPERSNHYTLRAGDGPDEAADPTTYAPGAFLTVHLRVRKTGWKYRGLLLNAVDESGAVVGRFHSPAEPGYPFHVDSGACPGSVLHADADRKPYAARFTFKAPPTGTGRITFRALIKRGWANTGYFHWPRQDLVLDEAGAAALLPTTSWHVGEDGQSCGMLCANISVVGRAGQRYCDAQAMAAAASSAGGLLAAAGHTHPVFAPVVADCSPLSPATRVADAHAAGAVRPVLPLMPLAALAFLLGARGPAAPLAALLCALAVLPGGAHAHNWMPTPGRAWNTASTAKPCLARKSTDTHQQVGKGQSFTLGFQTGHSGRHYIFVVHEDDEGWLAHPRLLDFAEEYVRARPAGSDSALDSRWKRYHGTKKQTSAAEMKPYNDDIAGMKSIADNAAQYPRLYERAIPQRVCDDGTLCVDAADNAKCADGTACKVNPDFLSHTRMKFVRKEDGGKKRTFGRLFEYRDEALAAAGDRRVSYASEKFPWLEAVHWYQNLANIGSDFDLVRASVPGRKGSGHYIVHWRWRGYRDCVDVDFFEDKSIASVDGRSGDGIVWNKIEHCQFEKPLKVLTPCRAVTGTAKQCIDDLYEAKGKGQLSKPQFRAGINVAPLKMPPAVSMWDITVSAPFHEPACVENNPLTRLGGADAFAPPGDTGGWAGWRTSARVREAAGKTCAESLFTDSKGKPKVFPRFLRDAVLDCTDSRCKGFAWKQGAGDTADAPFEGQKVDVVFCKTAGLASDAAWHAVLKGSTALAVSPTLAALESALPSAPAAADADIAFVDAIMVSFEPKGLDTSASVPAGFSLGMNFFVDNGEVFGARGNGQEYGWNCAQADAMVRGFKKQNPPTYWSTSVEMNKKCAGGAVRPDRQKSRFSFAVANGVYSVATYHGADAADRHIDSKNRGCVVENVRVATKGDKAARPASADKCEDGGVCGAVFGPMVVVVRDGRLDLSSPLGESGQCASTSWLRFKRIGDVGPGTDAAPPAVPSAWHTGATNAWFHRKLSERGAPVGIVIVTPPAAPASERPNNARTNTVKRLFGNKGSPYTDLGKRPFPAWSCRSRWLFAADDCAELAFELGVFDPDAPGGDDVGYVVTVSDEPCAGEAGCPATAKTTVCKPKRSEPYEPNYCGTPTGSQLCPVAHDCEGATGDYVRIALRGERRVFDAAVDVNRATVGAGADAMACWGVEGRPEETLPIPKNEYYTTDDPEDPVFYSTCYFKQNDWLWEPTGRAQLPTRAPWKYQGHCVACADYGQTSSSEKYEFPLWHTDPACRDCDSGAFVLKGWSEHNATEADDAGAANGGDSGADNTAGGAAGAVGAASGSGTATEPQGGVQSWLEGTSLVVGLCGAAALMLGALVLAAKRGRRARKRGPAAGSVAKQPMPAVGGSNPMWRDRGIGSAATEKQAAVGGGPVGAAAGAGPHAHAILPRGWNETVDEVSGRTYFYNAATGATSWERPTTARDSDSVS